MFYAYGISDVAGVRDAHRNSAKKRPKALSSVQTRMAIELVRFID